MKIVSVNTAYGGYNLSMYQLSVGLSVYLMCVCSEIRRLGPRTPRSGCWHCIKRWSVTVCVLPGFDLGLFHASTQASYWNLIFVNPWNESARRLRSEAITNNIVVVITPWNAFHSFDCIKTLCFVCKQVVVVSTPTFSFLFERELQYYSLQEGIKLSRSRLSPLEKNEIDQKWFISCTDYYF